MARIFCCCDCVVEDVGDKTGDEEDEDEWEEEEAADKDDEDRNRDELTETRSSTNWTDKLARRSVSDDDE